MSDQTTVEHIDAPQGSPEWHEARAGVITASMFSEILKVSGGLTDQQKSYVSALLQGEPEKAARAVAGYKSKPRSATIDAALERETVNLGDWTDAAKDYAFRVACERISGEPLDEGFQTWAMKRGHELEPDARATHGFQCNLDIQPTGFVRTKDGRFGASADGLIDPDGGAEYKCFIEPHKLRTILLSGDIDEYRAQCQGGLWLTGRAWWDFCLYCPALAPAGRELTRFRIERDEAFIGDLEATLLRFDQLVEEYRERICGGKAKADASDLF